jgi:hypothetical protein
MKVWPLARPINVVTDLVLLQELLAGLRQLSTDRPTGQSWTDPKTDGADR